MASIVGNAVSLNNNNINNNLIMNSSVNSNDINKTKLKFKNVVISLENCVLPSDQLVTTPSMSDGLDAEYEMDLRILGCELIQSSGILLRLPQVAMATAQVLFQRYYYSKSLVRFPADITAMACVTLASKIEEAPRRVRDVINVFHHMRQMRKGVEPKSLVLDENYITTKNLVIKAERRLLKELGFCVHVKHPHKFIVTLLQVLDNEKNHRLMQTSWNYMNDSLRTNVFVRYSSETIACACIYLSARVLNVPLPNNPNWFEVFGSTEAQIQDVCASILKLYVRPKPNQEELEKIVDNLRKTHENAKLKARELTVDNGTPNSTRVEVSPNSRTNSPLNKAKSENCSPKTKLKSITSVVSHTLSPNKKRTNDSPKKNRTHSRSKSRSISPLIRDKNYDNYDNRDRNRENVRERDRSPPKSYSYDYSRSRSRSREKTERTGSRHHKHKRITYSRSKSRSPTNHSHRHHNHNNKHHSYSSNSRKSRKRSKSPQPYREDRNAFTHSSGRRRSRDRDMFVYRRS